MSDAECESQLAESLSKLDEAARARVLARFAPASSSNSSNVSANATAAVQPRSFIRKLRNFSGRVPTPSNEVDYATWRVFVKQYLNDPEIRDSDLKSVVVSALSGPALSTVQHLLLSQEVDTTALFEVLESSYNRVQDGHELLVRFHDSIQSPKQSSSDYCQQLYILLCEVLQSKGISSDLFDQYLNR